MKPRPVSIGSSSLTVWRLTSSGFSTPNTPPRGMRHDAWRRPQRERLHLAHHQQASDIIDVAIGREHALDRRMARRDFGMQRRIVEDLLAQVRRRRKHHPVFAVGAHRDAALRARGQAAVPLISETAIRAQAIPLRQAAAGRGTKNQKLHAIDLAAALCLCFSERGGHIAGDFHADAHFAGFGGGPGQFGHVFLQFRWSFFGGFFRFRRAVKLSRKALYGP